MSCDAAVQPRCSDGKTAMAAEPKCCENLTAECVSKLQRSQALSETDFIMYMIERYEKVLISIMTWLICPISR